MKRSRVGLIGAVINLASCATPKPNVAFPMEKAPSGTGWYCTERGPDSVCMRSEAECVDFRHRNNGTECHRSEAAYCFMVGMALSNGGTAMCRQTQQQCQRGSDINANSSYQSSNCSGALP